MSKQDKFDKYDEYGEMPNEQISKVRIKDLLVSDAIIRNFKVSTKNRARLLWGFLFIIILFLLLTMRLAYWQIVRADDLKEKAVEMQKVDAEVDSVRGSIYDTNMNIMAKTITEYELYAYTQNIYKSCSSEEKKTTLKRLVKLTGKEEEELKKLLKGKENLVKIADGMDKTSVDKAKDYWGDNVIVKTKIKRYYPNGAFAAQLLGSVNSENSGRTGLEYQYNSVLAGVKGRTVKTTDSQGNTISNGGQRYYKAENGYSIVTTIDSVIQSYVEDALANGMVRTGAESITCIAMNPETGDILAYAQTPEYDPNNPTLPSDPAELAEYNSLNDSDKSNYLSRMWTVKGVSDVYEPGSTFKLIAASSALELGTASIDSVDYYCDGSIDVSGTELHCMGQHGQQSLRESVKNSCNPAMATVALNMGVKGYYKYINLFGFMNKTYIDLPGETNSLIKDPDTVSSVDLATLGYGQGIAITPIQLLTAVSAIGNDGYLMKPKVVKKIIDESGKTVEKIKDTKVRQVITKDTADKICEVMEYWVNSVQIAYVAGYHIGAKSGTADIASDGTYIDAIDGSLVAMAPMNDPKISLIVIVHKPTKASTGSMAAGPIVSEILQNILPYIGIEQEYTNDEKASIESNTTTVPDVTGISSEEAIARIESAGLSYKVMPASSANSSFVVKDQYPKAGSSITYGRSVYIYSE